MGVPYIPVLGLVGSDLLKRRDDMMIVPDPFQPEVKTVVARAYRPQVALLHAQKADRAGNVSTGRVSDDVILAEAARRVIVTVEEVVDHLDEAESEGTFLPSLLVDHVVLAPAGAHPGGCPGYYEVDEAHMRQYTQAAQSDETFAAYLQQVVFGVADHGEYVERFVAPGDGRAKDGRAKGGRVKDSA